MTHKLRGDWTSKRAWLDGCELNPRVSQAVHNHSPDGFNWGYGGSGPAQLALAVCLALDAREKEHYQDFKSRVIAALPQTDFETEFELAGEAKGQP